MMPGLLLPPLLLLASAAQASVSELAVWDLEADDGGFTTDEILPQWEWGTPLGGPESAFTGDRVWATDLDGNYINDNEASLALSSVDLSGATRPVLSLWHWHALRPGDEARIEVLDSDEWTVVDPIYGYGDGASAFAGSSSEWQQIHVDLTGLDDASAVRFTLATDAGGVSDGWYIDDLSIDDGDVVPPRIDEVDAPEEWDRIDQGPTISATVQDDVSLSRLVVEWSAQGVDGESAMTTLGADRWEATLPSFPPETVISWSIVAEDGLNTAVWPDDDPSSTRVFLPAPLDLVGPEGRVWGTTVPLSWTAPESTEELVGYRVYRNDEVVLDCLDTSAEVAAEGPTDRFAVRALYDTSLGELEGDQSDEIEVEVAVPLLEALTPNQAFQGDTLRVTVEGSLLLLQASSPPDLDLGEDIVVDGVEVRHVDQAVFTLSVAEDAATGPRDAELSTGGELLELVEAFEVVDGADRPALVSISPDALEQGASATLVLQTNTGLADDLLLDLGEGVVVESVAATGDQLTASVAVAKDAPVGARSVVLDDGVRILTLDEGFRVRASSNSGTGCQAAPALGGLLLSLLAALGRRRRNP